MCASTQTARELHHILHSLKANLQVAENQLIQLLPSKARGRLLALCRPAALTMADTLCESGARARYVYFPTAGYVSLIAMSAGTGGVEVGMVGAEGMIGPQLACGMAASAMKAVVQGPGTALRIHAGAFNKELTTTPALQHIVTRYLFVVMAQMANSASCMRFHFVGPRLARSLLMSQDRTNSDSFQMTQEMMGLVLGVRRVGVSVAAAELQRDGLIEYSRGHLKVLDRGGLERAACSCYAMDQQAYSGLLATAGPGTIVR